MDHRARSRRNGLAGYVVDRIAHLRADAGWIESRLRDPATRFVPVWRGRNLVTAGDGHAAVTLARGEAQALLAEAESLVLLGEDAGTAYFAAGVPARSTGLYEALAQRGEFRDLRDIGALLDARDGALLAHARAMAYWHHTHRFCGTCGAATASIEGGHSRVCTNRDCARSSYPRTDPAIIVAVSRGERLLLGRKPDWPAGRYSTIAGFVEPGETLEEAVAREVREETGIVCGAVQYQSSQPWPFPGSIMLGFQAEALTDAITVDRHELEDARWFTRDQLATGLTGGRLALPRRLSISYRLIEDWFDAASQLALRELPVPSDVQPL